MLFVFQAFKKFTLDVLSIPQDSMAISIELI
jgi:hypothetical protein